jgi:hypothetical protein
MQLLALSVARAALWKQASNLPYDETNAAEVAAVNTKINLACERFFSSGTWRGTLERAVITAYDNQVTLPRGLQTILGAKRDNSCRSLVHPIWFEFIGGSCSLEGTSGLNDLGEGFCTFRDIPVASKLVIRANEGSESEGVLVLGVTTATGKTQIEINLSDDATTINDPLVTSIFRINKPVTTNSVEVRYLDSGDEEVLIASLKPSETDANYRRYRVSSTTDTVEAICKRAYVPALSDVEPIVPNNLGALKLMLMSIDFENKVDMDHAKEYRQEAIDLADADRQQFDGDNQTPIFNVMPGFGVSSIPRLNGAGGFGYRGYSHYD